MNGITIGIFGAIIALTLAITAWAARRTRTATDFYAAGKGLTAAQNGFALAGDWCSAAAFLGLTGLTALYGMDGALYAIGPLVAFCTVLFIIAEPLRNTGTYTLGDVIHYRMKRPLALAAVVLGTIVINLAYMIPQMAGGGVLLKLLLGVRYDVSVVLVGLGMIVYVAAGGMLATSWVQIVKAVLMLSAGTIVLLMALWQVGFDPLVFFSADEARYGPSFLLPGNFLKNPWDEVSLGLGYVLGLAGLPHVMTRFYTVPDAKTARRSVVWVMFLAGAFFACTTIFGLAAAHFVGQDAVGGRPWRQSDIAAAGSIPRRREGLRRRRDHARFHRRRRSRDHHRRCRRSDARHLRRDRARPLCQPDKEGQRARACRGDGRADHRHHCRDCGDPVGDTRRGCQRCSACDPGDLHRSEHELSRAGAFVVLAPFQYRRRNRRDGIGVDLVGRARTDRPGLSGQGCAVATGQSDCGGSAAWNLGRRPRDTCRRSQRRA
jgi:hypothetical protein